VTYNIGSKVKQLRKARNMTLQNVADETGFSPALISQIENNNITPPIATLAKLSEFFEVKIGCFFEEEEHCPYEVVRASDNHTPQRKNGLVYRPLAGQQLKKNLEAYHITVSKSTRNHKLPDNGKEKFLLVTAGTISVEVDNEQIVLGNGDAIYLDANVSCRINMHQENAQLLAVFGPD